MSGGASGLLHLACCLGSAWIGSGSGCCCCSDCGFYRLWIGGAGVVPVFWVVQLRLTWCHGVMVTGWSGAGAWANPFCSRSTGCQLVGSGTETALCCRLVPMPYMGEYRCSGSNRLAPPPVGREFVLRDRGVVSSPLGLVVDLARSGHGEPSACAHARGCSVLGKDGSMVNPAMPHSWGNISVTTCS